MRVNIPKPCSENWAEMNPTQQGAFCKTCAVDVIDFSNKNAQEVKETLKANIGKHMCGRFKESQLSDLSHDYQVWDNQSTRTFQSKFLWACMIAFGLTLFTGCENSNAQTPFYNSYTENESTLTIDDSLDAIDDTIAIDTTIIPEQIVDSLAFVTGDITFYPDPPIIEEEIIMLGEPIIEFDSPDIVAPSTCQTAPVDSTETEKVIPVPNKHIMGKIQAPPRFDDYLADTVKRENIAPTIKTESIQAVVYPNPTVDESILKVKTNESEHYTIELYNFEGRKLKTIYAGKIDAQEQKFDLDLSSYPSGIYLVKITSDYVAHALKINKVN